LWPSVSSIYDEIIACALHLRKRNFHPAVIARHANDADNQRIRPTQLLYPQREAAPTRPAATVLLLPLFAGGDESADDAPLR
jgi:hypothetical protein